MSKFDDLQALGRMLDEGKIDREEYDRLKADLLAESEPAAPEHSMKGKPPGWYVDPSGRAEHQAYWDGEKWTGEKWTGEKWTGATGQSHANWLPLSEGEIWFKYEGRISAGQYWGRFVLFWLVTFAVTFAAGSSGSTQETYEAVVVVLFLFSVWPATALAWKRLHDQGRSGAMFLLVLIPLAGPIIWIVFSLLSGTSGPNRYGPATGYRWPEGQRTG